MPFVYHLCAADFEGSTLYPLSDLREKLPQVYEREVSKWKGRESVLDYLVPGLDIPWSQTVNLSSLHPRRLIDVRRALGMPYSNLLQRKLVSIPIQRISALPSVHFRSNSHWLNSSPGDSNVPTVPPESEFTPFVPSKYVEDVQVPQFHLDYLLRQQARGEYALAFVGVPHVLVAGAIDLEGLEFETLT